MQTTNRKGNILKNYKPLFYILLAYDLADLRYDFGLAKTKNKILRFKRFYVMISRFRWSKARVLALVTIIDRQILSCHSLFEPIRHQLLELPIQNLFFPQYLADYFVRYHFWTLLIKQTIRQNHLLGFYIWIETANVIFKAAVTKKMRTQIPDHNFGVSVAYFASNLMVSDVDFWPLRLRRPVDFRAFLLVS